MENRKTLGKFGEDDENDMKELVDKEEQKMELQLEKKIKSEQS